MTRVQWSLLGGTQVEEIVGVLLGREYPTSTRLRPGRGDGGIDVLVPVGDGRVDVYQIKSFASALTPGQRSQIRGSLERVANNDTVVVWDWHVTLPLNPTPGDRAWLNELCDDVEFDHYWFDLGLLEGLAAKYPDVVDYYVGDGRARLEETIERLRGLSGLSPSRSDRVLGPVDLVDPLTSVHALLNQDDPHYRYDFQVTGADTPMSRQVTPSLVARWSLSTPDTVITFDIHARYLQATDDRPIPISFTVSPERMKDASKQEWDRMLRYGTPVTLEAPAVSNVDIDLPVSIGHDLEVEMIRIGPAVRPGASRYSLRLRLIDPDDQLVAETALDMDPVTKGRDDGWRIHGSAPHEAFEFEIVGDSTPTSDAETAMHLSLKVGALTGAPPSGLRSAIRFLAAFHQPNRLQFLPEFGPPVAPPIDLPASEAPVSDLLVELIEALADLQDHVGPHLVTPDLDDLEPEAAAAILRGGRLVRGETIRSKWTEYRFTFAPGDLVEFPDGINQFQLGGEHIVEVNGHSVVLEPITTVLLAAEVTTRVSDGGDVELIAHPAFGNDTQLTWLVAMEDAPAFEPIPGSALMPEPSPAPIDQEAET